jgi:hypothetical protein
MTGRRSPATATGPTEAAGEAAADPAAETVSPVL